MSNTFKNWIGRMGITVSAFQKMTGKTAGFTNPLNKRDPDLVTRYAMSAIAAGLEPWEPGNAHEPEIMKPVLEAARNAASVYSDAKVAADA